MELQLARSYVSVTQFKRWSAPLQREATRRQLRLMLVTLAVCVVYDYLGMDLDSFDPHLFLLCLALLRPRIHRPRRIFPHDQNFRQLSPAEFTKWFKMSNLDELSNLCDHIQIPLRCKTNTGIVFHGYEGLALVLRRLSVADTW